MKALYFDGLPIDLEQRKARDPGRVTMMGAPLFGADVFAALLKYGTFDRMFVPPIARRSAGDIRDSPLFVAHRERITFLPEHELPRLREAESAVFLTPWMDLANMARLRRLAGRPGTPITGLIHSINYSWHLRFMLLLLLSPLEAFDALMCSSTAGREAVTNLLRLIGDRLARGGWPQLESRLRLPLIPLGVDASLFEGVDGTDRRASLTLTPGPVLLYFGRLSTTSKADLLPLMLAVRHVRAHGHPDVQLVLAGDDTHYHMADSLQAFADRLCIGAATRVVPNPTREAKRELYAMADIFVSPSDNLQETFGVAVVEAMAAGLPAVVSDWDGYKDLVVEGETGFRVRTLLPQFPARFDDLRGSGEMLLPDLLAAATMVDVMELADRIGRLAGDAEMRRRMGETGRRRAKALYDWPRVIAQYEALWAELIADAAHPSEARSAALNLEQFGYQEIFGHYSTEVLSRERRLRATGLGLDWPFETLAALTQSVGTDTWLHENRLAPMLAFVVERPDARVADLIEAFGDGTEIGEIGAVAHLSRLIKYGLIEVLHA